MENAVSSALKQAELTLDNIAGAVFGISGADGQLPSLPVSSHMPRTGSADGNHAHIILCAGAQPRPCIVQDFCLATKTECVIADEKEKIVGRGFGGSGNYQVCGIETASASMENAVSSANHFRKRRPRIAHIPYQRMVEKGTQRRIAVSRNRRFNCQNLIRFNLAD